MTKHAVALLVLGSSAAGCDVLGASLDGRWDVELTDFDDCGAELEIEDTRGEITGEADVFCRLYFEYDGELFYYDLEESRADVEGERDGRDFELEITFFDDFLGYEVEVVLEGELDGDVMDGDAELDGDDAGEFEGSR